MSLLARLDEAFERNPDPDAVQAALNDPLNVWRLGYTQTEEFLRTVKGRNIAVYNFQRGFWSGRLVTPQKRIINLFSGYDREGTIVYDPRDWSSCWAFIGFEYWNKIPCPPAEYFRA